MYNTHINSNKPKENLNEHHQYSWRPEESLECLAEDYGVEYEFVANLAGLLSSSEDFDGLVNAVEDYSESLDV